MGDYNIFILYNQLMPFKDWAVVVVIVL